MIRVQIAGQECRMDDGEWTSRNPVLQRTLRVFHRDWMAKGPHGQDPDPDLSAAEAAVKAMNGKILSLDAHVSPETIQGRDY